MIHTETRLDVLDAEVMRNGLEGAVLVLNLEANADVDLGDDVILEAVRERCGQALDDALKDARAAFELGLGTLAENTFVGAMRQAGIEAAVTLVRKARGVRR